VYIQVQKFCTSGNSPCYLSFGRFLWQMIFRHNKGVLAVSSHPRYCQTGRRGAKFALGRRYSVLNFIVWTSVTKRTWLRPFGMTLVFLFSVIFPFLNLILCPLGESEWKCLDMEPLIYIEEPTGQMGPAWECVLSWDWSPLHYSSFFLLCCWVYLRFLH
jgi:hypothetical protein